MPHCWFTFRSQTATILRDFFPPSFLSLAELLLFALIYLQRQTNICMQFRYLSFWARSHLLRIRLKPGITFSKKYVLISAARAPWLRIAQVTKLPFWASTGNAELDGKDWLSPGVPLFWRSVAGCALGDVRAFSVSKITNQRCILGGERPPNGLS